ncbi:MAG: DUF1841 family protein [Gammaproteobacteria bacterium]|nr:DUF1841 family protein [Gammaproteobacteria bacterium]
MFAGSREDSRRFFQTCWQKRQAGAALEPLERLVLQVIDAHPEYLDEVKSADVRRPGHEPDHNPFLHMGLHIALIEQLQADRPNGVRLEYQRLSPSGCDLHEVEHRMMWVLFEVLHEAQTRGAMPDEQAYLARLRQLALE